MTIAAETSARTGASDEPVPGSTGRTMNRRGTKDEIETGEIADAYNFGASSGGTRSPKVLQKNRKIRRAA